MSDRFDLEQGIMECWNIVDDLKILSEYACESGDFHRDGVANITIGLGALYQLKFEKLFRTFESVLKNEWDANKRLDEITAQYDALLEEAESKKAKKK